MTAWQSPFPERAVISSSGNASLGSAHTHGLIPGASFINEFPAHLSDAWSPKISHDDTLMAFVSGEQQRDDYVYVPNFHPLKNATSSILRREEPTLSGIQASGFCFCRLSGRKVDVSDL